MKEWMQPIAKPGNGRPRILLVDDEPSVLEAYVRNLRSRFDVTTASSGAAGLETLRRDPSLAAVVSDLKMPVMDGIAFLRRAREVVPDTVRVLLSGQADLTHAISAVNEASIFRFITKPCPPALLIGTLEAAVEQHRLVTAERVLLEQTLRGSVQALTDILALVNPAAFGRATRLRQSIQDLVGYLGVPDSWASEVAAMLSQVGSVTLPPAVVEKLYRGEELSAVEQTMVDRIPGVVEGLLGNIPRLEPVREVLRYQRKNFDGSGEPRDRVAGEAIPWGARALRLALDFDSLEASGQPLTDIFATLRARKGCYDPVLLEALAQLRGAPPTDEIALLPVAGMRPGMVLAEDVKTLSGVLLVARGQEVTPSLLARIHNFVASVGVREPVKVRVCSTTPPHQSEPRPL